MVFERFGLTLHDIANYELGRFDIPTRLLAELDRMLFNLSWVLNWRGEKHLASAPAPGSVLPGKNSYVPEERSGR